MRHLTPSQIPFFAGRRPTWLLLGALLAATGCGSLSVTEVYVDSGPGDQGPVELPEPPPLLPAPLEPSRTLPERPVTPPSPAMPATAYERADGPPPVQARMVAPEEYAALVERGLVVPTSQAERRWQALVAALGSDDDRARVRAFEQAHRRRLVPRAPAPTAETGEALRATGDGNHLQRLVLATGQPVDVVTHGWPWMLSTAADTLDQYPTRDNQLAVYRTLHAAVREHWDSVRLGMPHPDNLASDTEYPVEFISALNRRITDAASQLLTRPEEVPAGEPWEGLSPGAGVLVGTDQLRNSTDARCQPAAAGPLVQGRWPMKYLVSPAKDQGLRGSATAFALVSALETALARDHGLLSNLSEQAVYAHLRLSGERGDFGDGVLPGAAAAWLRQERARLPVEESWRYNPAAGRDIQPEDGRYSGSCDGYLGACSEWAHQSPMVCTDLGPDRYCGFATGAWQAEEDEAAYQLPPPAELWDHRDPVLSLERTLLVARVRPVVASLVVTGAWPAATAAGGVISAGPEDAALGGHVVHLVGHLRNADLEAAGVDLPPGDGGGHVIVKSSWSNCWGDSGFGYLSFELARSSILSAVALGSAR